MSDSLLAKLLNIQCELKAPKNQFNKFGKYNYRNCEDILEAVKPLCKKYNTTLRISDEIVQVGDRYYIKATAELLTTDEAVDAFFSTAYAREPESQKGMNEAQITGSASSYARKYALNGLFLIDDTRDADFHNQGNGNNTESHKKPETPKAGTKAYKDFEFLNHAKKAKEVIGEQAYYEVLGLMGYEKANQIPPKDREQALNKWRERVNK